MLTESFVCKLDCSEVGFKRQTEACEKIFQLIEHWDQHQTKRGLELGTGFYREAREAKK